MRMPTLRTAALTAAIALGGALLPACGRAAQPPTSQTTMPDSVAASNNEFGFNLFRRLYNAGPTANVFMSPASVALALEMVYNGAQGRTREAMAETLHIAGISPDLLNRSNGDLISGLRAADPKVELNIANSLWYRPNEAPNPAVVQKLTDNYGAEIGDLGGGAAVVNAWVDKQTHGKIPTIVTPGDVAASLAILANAVYFKGAWTAKFDAALTRDEPFTHLDGERKPCKMMHQTGTYRYAYVDGVKAIEIPYGNRRLTLVVLLPDAGKDFSRFATGLSDTSFAGLLGQMKPSRGELGLPRLHVEYSDDLVKPLAALGMAPAFDPRVADFRGLFPAGGVCISHVKHKTYLDSNEEGTTAAAATAVVMMRAVRLPTANKFTMLVDHPFVLALRDSKTGAILFLGAVVDPGKGT